MIRCSHSLSNASAKAKIGNLGILWSHGTTHVQYALLLYWDRRIYDYQIVLYSTFGDKCSCSFEKTTPFASAFPIRLDMLTHTWTCTCRWIVLSGINWELVIEGMSYNYTVRTYTLGFTADSCSQFPIPRPLQ